MSLKFNNLRRSQILQQPMSWSKISVHILQIKFMSTSCRISLKWMLQDTFDDKSTLVQVTAWCYQAASHYLSQCWPRCVSLYGVTRPQWVKRFKILKLLKLHFCVKCNFSNVWPRYLTWNFKRTLRNFAQNNGPNLGYGFIMKWI